MLSSREWNLPSLFLAVVLYNLAFQMFLESMQYSSLVQPTTHNQAQHRHHLQQQKQTTEETTNDH
jgi:hypothetical protein